MKTFFEFLNPILPFVAIVISICALIRSGKANKIANDANEISNQMRDDTQRPRLKLVSLSLDPQNVHIYGGKNITWAGKLPLRDDLFNVIKDSFRSDSVVTFKVEKEAAPQEYLLINLCGKDSQREDIGLILNAITFSVENQNTDNPISELTIEEAYSMISSSKPFPLDMKLRNSTITIHENPFSVNLAYACCHYESSSLNLGGIAGIKASGETDIINLIDSPERAGEIIAFADTAYLFSCKTTSGQRYEFSLVISKNPSTGDLKDHFIYYKREEFDKRAAAASERANKKVVIKREP